MNEKERAKAQEQENDAGDIQRAEARGAEDKKKFSMKHELFDWAEALVIALAIVIVTFALLARLTGVDGTSMVPSLHDKDQILISHLFYDKPERGDIVVLQKNSFVAKPIVKRVIATEGQTVSVDPLAGTVTVDGEVLYEPYINEITQTAGDTEYPLTVPENCVFVMGDNRNKSSDSRDSRLGVVDTRYIVGKLLCRVFPFDQMGPVE